MSHEINFDGLIGPTHNYAGLSFGNVASANYKHSVSFPRQAALQGLAKMETIAAMGTQQFFLPPPCRPNFSALKQLGFSGDEKAMIKDCHDHSPALLASVYSAASMWTANAATVTPSTDAADNKIHFTPANLARTFHRSFDHVHTANALKAIFQNTERFIVHDALPSSYGLSDEGAANHTRLCASHDQPGLHLMVFGFDPLDSSLPGPKTFPARQSSAASEAIMRRHGTEHYMLIQQTPEAIDAGVFHNDVISVGNENVLLFHERAFVDSPKAIAEIGAFFENQQSPWFPFEFTAAELPIQDAVQSYFFNSQIVTRPDKKMSLICPIEVSETETARRCAEKIVNGDGPIDEVNYFDLRQSMNNGGGPACLRLRVVVSEQESELLNRSYQIDDSKVEQLRNWVADHYREELSVADLVDPALVDEVKKADAELQKLLRG